MTPATTDKPEDAKLEDSMKISRLSSGSLLGLDLLAQDVEMDEFILEDPSREVIEDQSKDEAMSEDLKTNEKEEEDLDRPREGQLAKLRPRIPLITRYMFDDDEDAPQHLHKKDREKKEPDPDKLEKAPNIPKTTRARWKLPDESRTAKASKTEGDPKPPTKMDVGNPSTPRTSNRSRSRSRSRRNSITKHEDQTKLVPEDSTNRKIPREPSEEETRKLKLPTPEDSSYLKIPREPSEEDTMNLKTSILDLKTPNESTRRTRSMSPIPNQLKKAPQGRASKDTSNEKKRTMTPIPTQIKASRDPTNRETNKEKSNKQQKPSENETRREEITKKGSTSPLYSGDKAPPNEIIKRAEWRVKTTSKLDLDAIQTKPRPTKTTEDLPDLEESEIQNKWWITKAIEQTKKIRPGKKKLLVEEESDEFDKLTPESQLTESDSIIEPKKTTNTYLEEIPEGPSTPEAEPKTQALPDSKKRTSHDFEFVERWSDDDSDQSEDKDWTEVSPDEPKSDDSRMESIDKDHEVLSPEPRRLPKEVREPPRRPTNTRARKLFSDEKEEKRYTERQTQTKRRQTSKEKPKSSSKNPKRPMNSFLLYNNFVRARVHEENPDFTPGEVSKEIGIRYNNMDTREKAKWLALAEMEKKRFKKEANKNKKSYLQNQALTKRNIRPRRRDSDYSDEEKKFESQSEEGNHLSDRPPTPEPVLKRRQRRFGPPERRFTKKQEKDYDYLATHSVPEDVVVQTIEINTPSINGRPAGSAVAFKTNCKLQMSNFSDLFSDELIADIFENEPNGLQDAILNNMDCETPLEIVEFLFAYPHTPLLSFAHGDTLSASLDILHTLRVFSRYDSDEKDLTAIIGFGKTGKLVSIDKSLNLFTTRRVKVPKPWVFALEAFTTLDTPIPDSLMEMTDICPTLAMTNKVASAMVRDHVRTADEAFCTLFDIVNAELTEEMQERGLQAKELTMIEDPDLEGLDEDFKHIDRLLEKKINRYANFFQTLWFHCTTQSGYYPNTRREGSRIRWERAYKPSSNKRANKWLNSLQTSINKKDFDYQTHLQDEGLENIEIDPEAFKQGRWKRRKGRLQTRSPIPMKNLRLEEEQYENEAARKIFPQRAKLTKPSKGRLQRKPHIRPERVEPKIVKELKLKPAKMPTYDYPPYNQEINWNHEEGDELEDSEDERLPLKKRIAKRARDYDKADLLELSEMYQARKARRIMRESPSSVCDFDKSEKYETHHSRNDLSQDEIRACRGLLQLDPKKRSAKASKRNPFESQNYYEAIQEEDEDDFEDEEMDEIVERATERTNMSEDDSDEEMEDISKLDDGSNCYPNRPTTNANGRRRGNNWRAPTPYPNNRREQTTAKKAREKKQRKPQNPFEQQEDHTQTILTQVMRSLDGTLSQLKIQSEQKMEQDRKIFEEKEENKIPPTTLKTALNTGTRDGINPAPDLTPENKMLMKAKVREVPKILRQELAKRGAKCQPCPNIITAINQGEYARSDPFRPDALTVFSLPINQQRTELRDFDFDQTQYEYENGLDITAKQRNQLTKAVICLPITVFYLIEAIKSFAILMDILFGDESLAYFAAICWYNFIDNNSQHIIDMSQNGHRNLTIKIAWQIDMSFSAFFSAAQRGVPNKVFLECSQIQQSILMGNYTIILPRCIQNMIEKRQTKPDRSNTRGRQQEQNESNHSSNNNRQTNRQSNRQTNNGNNHTHLNQPEALKCNPTFFSKVITNAITKHQGQMPKLGDTTECARYIFKGTCFDNCPRKKAHKPVTDKQREDRLVQTKKEFLDTYRKNKKKEDPDFQ